MAKGTARPGYSTAHPQVAPQGAGPFHYELSNRRLTAWSRSLSEIRRKLGFPRNGDENPAPAHRPMRATAHAARAEKPG